MKFYQNGKRISRKKLEEKLGKETVAQRVQSAKNEWVNDPGTLMLWLDGMKITHDMQE